MPLGNPIAGVGYAAEFQSSALPWVTSSTAAAGAPVRYDFEKVTRFICVSNLGATTDQIAFGFTSLGTTGSNCYKLNAGQSIILELRVNSLYLKAITGTPNYSILAGLTTVPATMMAPLTGSNGWTAIG